MLLDDTAACASPIKLLNLPAILANTWTLVEIDPGDMSACTAIISVGLKQVVDKGVMNIFIDYIGWTGQVTWQIAAVSNAPTESAMPVFGTLQELTATVRYYFETEHVFPSLTIGGTPAAAERLRAQITRKNHASDTHGAGKVCFLGAILPMDRGA